MKPKLLQIKSQTPVLIAHIHVHTVHPQMRIPLQRAAANLAAHAQEYKRSTPTPRLSPKLKRPSPPITAIRRQTLLAIVSSKSTISPGDGSHNRLLLG